MEELDLPHASYYYIGTVSWGLNKISRLVNRILGLTKELARKLRSTMLVGIPDIPTGMPSDIWMTSTFPRYVMTAMVNFVILGNFCFLT